MNRSCRTRFWRLFGVTLVFVALGLLFLQVRGSSPDWSAVVPMIVIMVLGAAVAMTGNGPRFRQPPS